MLIRFGLFTAERNCSHQELQRKSERSPSSHTSPGHTPVMGKTSHSVPPLKGAQWQHPGAKPLAAGAPLGRQSRSNKSRGLSSKLFFLHTYNFCYILFRGVSLCVCVSVRVCVSVYLAEMSVCLCVCVCLAANTSTC